LIVATDFNIIPLVSATITESGILIIMPKGIYKRIASSWSKGLTKETDERVNKMSINVSIALTGKKLTSERIAKIKKNTKLAMSRPEVKKKLLDNQPDRSGKNNSAFIGGKIRNKRGRWTIWLDSEKKRVSYARYITEQCLRRKLSSKEVVHHINKDQSDDRPENLYVFKEQSEHCRHHFLKNSPILILNLVINHKNNE